MRDDLQSFRHRQLNPDLFKTTKFCDICPQGGRQADMFENRGVKLMREPVYAVRDLDGVPMEHLQLILQGLFERKLMRDGTDHDRKRSHLLVEIVMTLARNTATFFFLSGHQFARQFPDFSVTAAQFFFSLPQSFFCEPAFGDIAHDYQKLSVAGENDSRFGILHLSVDATVVLNKLGLARFGYVSKRT